MKTRGRAIRTATARRALAIAMFIVILSQAVYGLASDASQDHPMVPGHEWYELSPDPHGLRVAIQDHLDKTVPVDEWTQRLDHAEAGGLLRIIGATRDTRPETLLAVEHAAVYLHWLGESGLFLAKASPDGVGALFAMDAIAYLEPDAPIEFHSAEATVQSSVRSTHDGTSGQGTGIWTYNPITEELESDVPYIEDAITGDGITVAVLDSGIDATHPDFYDWVCVTDEQTAIQERVDSATMEADPTCANRVVLNMHATALLHGNLGEGAEMATTETSNAAGDAGYAHGTHVAGIIAGNARAARDGESTLHFGVAPEASLIGIGVGATAATGTGSIATGNNQAELPAGWKWFGMAGLQWVLDHTREYNIRAVSNAWACQCTETWDSPLTLLVKDLYDARVVTAFPTSSNFSTGVIGITVPYALSVGAYYAGDGTPTRHPVSGVGVENGGPPEPATWTPEKEGFRPRNFVVGSFRIAPPDIMAPGADITAPAALVPSLNNEQRSSTFDANPEALGLGRRPGATGDAAYQTFTGTSMATAQIAGIAALLADGCPGAITLDIMRAIFVGADAMEDYHLTGYGAVDARASLDWLQEHVPCEAGVPPWITEASAKMVEGIHTGEYSFSASARDPDGEDSGLSYGWDFGDGGTATGAQAAHVYQQPGIYRIKLTVTDASGARTSHTENVVVAPAVPSSLETSRPITIRSETDLNSYRQGDTYVIENKEIILDATTLDGMSGTVKPLPPLPLITVPNLETKAMAGIRIEALLEGMEKERVPQSGLVPWDVGETTAGIADLKPIIIKNVVIRVDPATMDEAAPDLIGVHVDEGVNADIYFENVFVCGLADNRLVHGVVMESAPSGAVRSLKDVSACNVDGAGILLQGVAGFEIHGCTVVGASTGIRVESIADAASEDGLIKGCRLVGNDVGLTLSDDETTGLELTDNAFVSNGQTLEFIGGAREADQTWHSEPQSGTNVLGGECLAGNHWQDYPGDGRLNYGEPIYLTTNADCIPTIQLNDIRLTLTNPKPLAKPGSLVEPDADGTEAIENVDLNQVCSPLAQGAGFAYVDDGDGSFGAQDAVYVDSDGNGVVTYGDVRITAAEGHSAGSRVDTNDADIGQSYLQAGRPAVNVVQWHDADGTGSWTPGDIAYLTSAGLDAGTTTSAVALHDVRLTPVDDFGSRVTLASADHGNELEHAGTFQRICFLDLQGDQRREPAAAIEDELAVPHHGDALPLIKPKPHLAVPQVSFTPQNPLAGEDVVAFDAATIDPGDAVVQYWFWDFGDGTVFRSSDSTKQEARHEFSAGSYNTRLTIVDDQARSATASIPIDVNSRPRAGFNYVVQSTVVSLMASCTEDQAPPECSIDPDPEDQGNLAYTWDYTISGGGGSASFKEGRPDHAPMLRFDNSDQYFDTPRDVTVTLTLEDGRPGGISTLSRTFQVHDTGNPPPDAAFDIDAPERLLTGQPVQFTDLSTDNDDIVQWTWDFGDGKSFSTTDPTAKNPTHVYEDGGQDGTQYEVRLTVTDNGAEGTEGLTGTTKNVVTVFNRPPAATFDVSVDQPFEAGSIHASDLIRFQDGSTDPDGSIVDREWILGGQTTPPNGPLDGSYIELKFLDDGVYDVTLVVTDDDGNQSMHATVVNVLNTPPHVDIAYTREGTTTQHPVLFLPGQTHDPDLAGSIDPESWLWEFGDGTTSTQQQPEHVYKKAGPYEVTLTVKDDDGAVSSITETITIDNAIPTGHFDIEPRQPNINQPVSFIPQIEDPDGSIISYTWEFEEGASQTLNDGTVIEHVYGEPGSYTVRLAVEDDDGGVLEVTRELRVTVRPPNAFFSWEAEADDGPWTGEPVTFFDQSSDDDGSIVQWHWDFGDDGTWTTTDADEAGSVSHVFTDSGEHKIRLTVTDDRGESSFYSERLVIKNRAPEVSYTFAPDKPMHGQVIEFTPSVHDEDGTVVAYRWDFGDGSASTEEVPNHTYATKGSYTVTLTVIDDDGARSKVTRLVRLANTAPDASIDFAPDHPDTSQEVRFTAIGSDNDGTISSYRWNFGDDHAASGRNVTHRFADDGLYNVTLRVTDDDGNTTEAYIILSVRNTPPTADFDYTPTNASTQDVIAFQVTAYDADGRIERWWWDFGDGTNTTTLRPSHRYEQPGLYHVVLVVEDDDGATHAKTSTVRVSNLPPAVAFTHRPEASPTKGHRIQFEDQTEDSEGSVVSHSWDFGDGNNSSEKRPSHTFESPGAYLVTLTVRDSHNATASSSHLVVVEAEEGVHIPQAAPTQGGHDAPASGLAVVALGLAVLLIRIRRVQ